MKWLAQLHKDWMAARKRRVTDSGTKGDFEQESLGPPQLSEWPFYR